MLENFVLTRNANACIKFRAEVNASNDVVLIGYYTYHTDVLYPLAKVINRGDADGERICLGRLWDAMGTEFMNGVSAFLASEAPIAFEDIMDSREYGFHAKVVDCIKRKAIDVYPWDVIR